MKSEEIYLHIGKLLQKFDRKKENPMTPMEGFKDLHNPTGHFDDLKVEIIQGLDMLFEQSDKEDFFWYDCPLTVYRRTLLNRVEYYRQNGNPSITVDDLLRFDYKYLFHMPRFEQRVLMTDKKELNRFQSLDYGPLLAKDNSGVGEKLELDRLKKMNFIQDQFKEQGKILNYNGSTFELLNLPSVVKEVTVQEPHTNIFSNNGFKLFQYILTNSVSEHRGRKSDIAYFYWMMYNDNNKYIHARPEPFKVWYNQFFNDDLGDKLKTLSNVQNPKRDKEYSRALNWFKEQ